MNDCLVLWCDTVISTSGYIIFIPLSPPDQWNKIHPCLADILMSIYSLDTKCIQIMELYVDSKTCNIERYRAVTRGIT